MAPVAPPEHMDVPFIPSRSTVDPPIIRHADPHDEIDARLRAFRQEWFRSRKWGLAALACGVILGGIANL